ncbi:organic cation transporter protein-like [Lycorma delicatula]|uniref:organic cation transporter protein-like n=1 Tax=Lycorma delicatula TaxID=130591 RepID=UPI003F518432
MSDDLVDLAIGKFGWWQLRCSLLMSLLRIPNAWFQFAILFIAPDTRFVCREFNISNENTTYTVDSCKRKDGNFCDVWDYDRTIFTETIITQWDLVCDKKHLVPLTQTSFMFGVLIGNLIFGILADKHGRKLPLMVAILIQVTSGIASSYVTSLWLFLLLRFFLALATGGTMITSFVICMESLSGKWRTIISILYQIPFGLGQAFMATVSYYYRDWRDLNLFLSLLASLFLFYWWLIPESPRWLLAVGRSQEAIRLLKAAAITNNRSEEQIKAFISLKTPSINREGSKTANKKANIQDLFTNSTLRQISVCIFLSWFIAGLCFFGLNQYQGQLGGDLFYNVALSGIFGGIPGPLISVYVVQKFGRRHTILLSLTISGVACLLISTIPIGVYPRDWPRRVLSITSLMGMSVSYPTLYLFSGEQFPTVVRNIGVGTASMCARIGSMLASFVLLTDAWGSWVPLVLLGLLTIASAFFLLPLPETKDRPLPDTIEELDRHKRESKNSSPQTGKHYTAVPCNENTQD